MLEPMERVEELVAGLVVSAETDLFVRLTLTADGGTLEVLGSAGITDSDLSGLKHDPSLRAPCVQARQTGAPVVRNRLAEAGSPLYERYGLTAVVVIPPPVASGTETFLVFGARTVAAFEHATVERLQRIARVVHTHDQENQLRAQQLRRLVIQLIEAEDRERRRIATLLHDDLQQTLAGIKVHIDMAARRTRHDDYVTSRLETAGDLLDEAIERSRGLSHELSPPMLRMRGLIPALRVLASEAQRTQNLRVTISAPQEDPILSPLAGQVTYRAVQELLFNIIKHAGIDEATVDLAERDAGLEITVRDHGRGFDVESTLKQDSPTGLGLLSLRERIEAIGGVLEIQSIVGAGSAFTIFLPSSATMAEGVLKETTPDLAGKPRNGRKLSVLVVDDHAVIRQGLVLLLNEEPDLEVVGEASGGDAAVELAHQLLPDVVVMDLAMPGLAGDEATRAILSKAPDTRIVGLSMHSEEEARDRMMSSGAAAYLSKAGPSSDLIAAVRGRSARPPSP